MHTLACMIYPAAVFTNGMEKKAFAAEEYISGSEYRNKPDAKSKK